MRVVIDTNLLVSAVILKASEARLSALTDEVSALREQVVCQQLTAPPEDEVDPAPAEQASA